MSNGAADTFKKNAINAENAQANPSKRIRAAIVGVGWIARAHIESYLRCPDVDLVALAELNPGKAEALIKTLGIEDRGIRVYASAKEMYETEHLDIVSVCTSSAYHASSSIEALEAGVHVLCEKPMCTTLDEAVAMVRAARKADRLLSIGFQPRMSKYMRDIVRVVQSGELGEVYYLQAGGGRRHGIPTPFGTSFIQKETAGYGAMGDIGCYSLDMLLNAVGYPKPLTVSAYTSDFFGKDPNYYTGHPEYAEKFNVDDFAAAFIRLEGGIILDFRISWAMHMDTTGDALILGKKGGLKIPSTECWNGSGGGPLTIYHEVAGKMVETRLPYEEEDVGELLYAKVRAFVDAAAYGAELPCPGEQILYNQAILDGIARSAELGREVEIVIPEL